MVLSVCRAQASLTLALNRASDNPQYVEQVAAMEAKARELGIGRTIHYMFPQNGFLNEQDIAKASALSPRIDDLI